MCHEVADLMDMQSGTVKSRLHRIRAVLSKELRAA
jgi:DNA-directed RNA polymerase specialized sigma24 family protein